MNHKYFSSSHRASRDRGHKSVTVEKEEDDGLLLTYDEDSGNDGQKRMDVSKRKRSFNHLRMLERDAKFDINSTSPSDIASSLPAISSQSSMKARNTFFKCRFLKFFHNWVVS